MSAPCRTLCPAIPALAALLGLGAVPTASADVIGEIVDEVSQANYVHYLEDLLYTHEGDTRGLPPYDDDHDPARDNILAFFTDLGLDASLDPFEYSPFPWRDTYHNVVAVKEGVVNPDVIYVCGAHYDSVDQSPGADDNGSGVAGVMEAARVLAPYDLEATIIFIAFDREEQFMVGSQAWVSEHLGDDIQGALCLDMIAYNETGLNHLLTRSWYDGNNPFQETVNAAVNDYSGGLNAILSYGGYSDHWSFAQAGILECGLHEEDENPYYHEPEDNVDRPDYLDYDFAYMTTRGLVAALATVAGVVGTPGDVNGDGVVNTEDLLALLAAWGSCPDPPEDCPADFNGDDVVNTEDLLTLLANWG
ncbi:MAG: M28 family peptidase [Planctomycetota bacterium]|nr:M28 family peptidase [Planctomycetota bacterium]